jgi:radical SAM superfamily enzyme YgiQ (UPF0313 family)
LHDITLGIQSGSKEIAHKIFNRKIHSTEIIYSSKILSELGVKVYYDLITNNPYETDETHHETLELLLKLSKPYHLRTFKMRYYPNVPLTNQLIHDKIIQNDDVESRKETSFAKWIEAIDTDRYKNQQELFWDCIYFMVENNFPKFLIVMIKNQKVFRKSPRLLAIPIKHIVIRGKSINKRFFNLLNYIKKGDFEKIWKVISRKKIQKGWGY